jgi:hypothetical protein
MKPQEVLRHYRTFWMAYQTLCQSAGALAKPSDGGTIQLLPAMAKPGQVVIGSNIYLPDWRLRGGAASNRVHILVNSLETYIQAENRIAQSSVQVLYTRVSGSTATSLLAVHYDYHHIVQAAHPVFHAQFGMGDFSSPAYQQMGFRFSGVGAPPKETLYSSVRIPTACMGLASVLLGLAADHLDPKFLNSFVALAAESQLTKWNAMCDSLEQSMANRCMMPSYHWYSKIQANAAAN